MEKSNINYIPESEEFIENKELLKTLEFGIKENIPVLLIGETGTGKTSAVRFLANKMKKNFRRLNLNGHTTADEFVGKILVNEQGTYWVDGILTDAMRNGHWILLDEINSALPEVLFVLQSLLDDDKYIVLSDKPEMTNKKGEIISIGNEIVRPHPEFRLFATMNPSDNYVGTKELNKALLSRFPLVLEVEYPTEAKELKIVKSRFPKEDEAELMNIISFGNQLRDTYRAGEMDFIFSTRELLNWVKINKFFKDWMKSAEVSFLGKCNKEDREAVISLMKINFKKADSTVDLQKGMVLIATEDCPVFKTNFLLAKKTTYKINATGMFGNEPIIKIKVESIPVGNVDKGDLFLSVGAEFSIKVSDIEGKYIVKRNG